MEGIIDALLRFFGANVSVAASGLISVVCSFAVLVLTRWWDNRHYTENHSAETRANVLKEAPELQKLYVNDVLQGDGYEAAQFLKFWAELEADALEQDGEHGSPEKVCRIHSQKMSMQEAVRCIQNSTVRNWRFFLLDNDTSHGLELLSFKTTENNETLDISNTSDAIIRKNQKTVCFCEGRDYPSELRVRYQEQEITYDTSEKAQLIKAH